MKTAHRVWLGAVAALAGCATPPKQTASPPGYLAQGPTVTLREARPTTERTVPETLWDLEVQMRKQKEELERVTAERNRLAAEAEGNVTREKTATAQAREAQVRLAEQGAELERLRRRERELSERLIAVRLRMLALEEQSLLARLATPAAGPSAPAGAAEPPPSLGSEEGPLPPRLDRPEPPPPGEPKKQETP